MSHNSREEFIVSVKVPDTRPTEVVVGIGRLAEAGIAEEVAPWQRDGELRRRWQSRGVERCTIHAICRVGDS